MQQRYTRAFILSCKRDKDNPTCLSGFKFFSTILLCFIHEALYEKEMSHSGVKYVNA